jgi:hypothetical protein
VALGSLIGAAFVRISADTKPAEKAIQGLTSIGSTALMTSLLPAANVVAVGVGAIATSFLAAGVAAGAFGAAVMPQLKDVQAAMQQRVVLQTAQQKADVAAAQAHDMATKGSLAYEAALAKASTLHAQATQARINGDKNAAELAKQAAQASLTANSLAAGGGKDYAAALAKAKTAATAAKTAQATYNDSLDGMPPATKQVADALTGLQDATKNWSASLAESTMPIFTFGIEKIQGLLPKLTPIVKTASGDIRSFLENFNSGTAGTVFKSFGTNLAGLSGGSLTDFLNIIKNITVGFAGILNAFTPMASGVTGGIVQITGKFAEWGATAGSNSGVQKFFDNAKKDAPLLATDLGKIATAATHIAGGLGPLSGIGLKVAEVFADILNALPVPILNQFINVIVATNVALKLYAVYSAAAAAATWLFSTATGASRVQMAGLRIQMALVYVQLKLQAIWNGIVTAAQWLWNTSIVSSIVSTIASTASLIARNAVMLASAAATGIMTAATFLWTAALLPAIVAIWSMTTALLASPITWIVIGIVALIAVIVLISTKTTWFQTAWKTSWSAIKDAAKATWDFIDRWAIQPMITAFNLLWDKVIRPIFKLIVDAYLNMAGIIVDGAAKMFGWIPGLGGKLKTAAKAFDAFKDSVNASLGGIKPKTIGVTVKFNGVPEGTITGHSYTSTTGFSYAGGGPVQGPGTETSDDVYARLSDNEHVWTAKEVRAAGGHRQVMRIRKAVLDKGVGQFADGGAAGSHRQAASMTVTEPSAAGIANSMKVSAAEVITRTTNQITQSYIKASRAALAAMGGVIPSGQHLQVINSALAAAGVPPPGTLGSWQSGLNTLITRESGWNASAINRTDINAQQGHPSQGLAQTIPGTFEHYVPNSLRGLGILNPVANVAAAIRYIVSRYGNITRVQQANANLPPQGYDVGGWLMPGATLAVNNTGRPERVVGPHESMEMTIHLTIVNQGVLGSQRDVQNWLIASLQQAKREGRLRGIVPAGP